MNIVLYSSIRILSSILPFFFSIHASEIPAATKKESTKSDTVIKRLASATCIGLTKDGSRLNKYSRLFSSDNYSRIRFKPNDQDQVTLPLTVSIERVWFTTEPTKEFRGLYDLEHAAFDHFASKELYTLAMTPDSSYTLTLTDEPFVQQIDFFAAYSPFVKAAQRCHAPGNQYKENLVRLFGKAVIPESASSGSARIHGPFLATTTNEGITRVYICIEN